MIFEKHQSDSLLESINSGMDQAANILSQMLESPIELVAPSLFLDQSENLESPFSKLLNQPLALVSIVFRGGAEGKAVFFLTLEGAQQLSIALAEEEGQIPCQDEREEVLTEIGNITINNVMGIVANIHKQHLIYEAPIYSESKNLVTYLEKSQDEIEQSIYIRSQLSIPEHKIEGGLLVTLLELKS
ncbi:MAG: hypothetical protein HQL32_12515 [Planctomycetes bacterium]|nr:hypothetical protein [Planctomycetota bacterium]